MLALNLKCFFETLKKYELFKMQLQENYIVITQ